MNLAIGFGVKILSSKYFFWITLALFVLQAFYIAASTKFGIPPDELYHWRFIEFYQQNQLTPFVSDQGGDYFLADITRAPSYLYHYIFSFFARLLAVFTSGGALILALRSINILFAAATIVTVRSIAKGLGLNRLGQNIVTFMLANTVMFLFLSASLNYDNLAILLSALAINLIVLILKKFSPSRLLLLAILFLVGPLVKFSYLPLSSVIGLVIVWKLIEERKNLAKHYQKLVSTTAGLVLIAVFLLSLGLFVERYGYNLVKLHSVEPNCSLIHSVEECSQNAVFERNEGLKAVEFSSTKKLPEYGLSWVYQMKDRVFGVLAHKSFSQTSLIEGTTWLLGGLVLFAFVRTTRLNDLKKHAPYLGLIVLYVGVLIIRNYGTYADTGLHLGVQGRYLFPILPLVYILGYIYVKKLKWPSYIYAGLIGLILISFLSGGIVSYIVSTDSSWHPEATRALNEDVRSAFEKVIP